ncbi:MAG: hypothetical protein LBT95_01300 [Treponema sp.]|jgi:hypothetical protein|nr:hypothetical protein [Treponema sp.]
MPIIIYFLPIPFLILISYFAFSRHSSFFIKRTALIALILIGLSIGVSLLLVFSEPAGKPGTPSIDIPVEPVVLQDNKNTGIIVGIFLLLFVGLIIFLALREQGKFPKKGEARFPGEEGEMPDSTYRHRDRLW